MATLLDSYKLGYHLPGRITTNPDTIIGIIKEYYNLSKYASNPRTCQCTVWYVYDTECQLSMIKDYIRLAQNITEHGQSLKEPELDNLGATNIQNVGAFICGRLHQAANRRFSANIEPSTLPWIFFEALIQVSWSPAACLPLYMLINMT